MNMKRWLAAVLTAALLLLPRGGTACAAEEEPKELACHAGVLMDAASGRVLWQRAADERTLIASTTKIMTALVALEHCDLHAEVTVDPAWTGIEGSSMYLAPGQIITVEELLYGLMLASGNDAAEALAAVTAGSDDAFAALMNEKARALGCANTHFVNASGLDDAEHYASAYDLALITRAALENQDLRRIVSTVSKTVGDNTFVNHNRLLRECEGVFGVKTGYTKAAGRTLVTACEREGITLICVTLSDPNDWDDHKALYDWAYRRYDRSDVLAGRDWSVPVIGGERESVRVAAQEGLFVVHASSEPIRVEYRLPAFVHAEVTAGAPCGEAVAYVDGVEVGGAALVYAEDVARSEKTPTLWERFLEMVS